MVSLQRKLQVCVGELVCSKTIDACSMVKTSGHSESSIKAMRSSDDKELIQSVIISCTADQPFLTNLQSSSFTFPS